MAKASDEKYWGGMRSQFLLPPDLIYLNNGSFGPAPRAVVEATIAYTKRLETNPWREIHRFRDELQLVKGRLGQFVGAGRRNIVFVTNVTVGMNMVCRGLKTLGAGDTILTTDQEYGAVDKAWEFVAAKKNLKLVRACLPCPPESADQLVDIMRRHMRPGVKVLYFSHITTKTGLIMPVKSICRLAGERGITTVIDGAHAPGMIPVNIKDLGCTFYVGNCHKWLCSVKGAGFLFASPEAQQRLEPLIVGAGWEKGKETLADRFERLGTSNLSIYLGVAEAIDFQLALGKRAIAARGRFLSRYGRDAFARFPGTLALTPPDSRLSGSMAAYHLSGLKLGPLKAALERRNIMIPAQEVNGGVRLRLSTHIYNTPAEVDALVQAVSEAYADR